MSTYLISKMGKGNSFSATCKIRLDGLPKTDPLEAKIDTGCSTTLISLNLLYPKKTEDELKQLALQIFEEAIKDKRISVGYGVESIAGTAKKVSTPEEALEDTHARAILKCTNLEVGGCMLGTHEIRVSYKIKNKALIGMGVMRDMCTYIGPYNGGTFLVSSRKAFFNTEKLMKAIVKKLKQPENPDAEYIDYSEEDIRANYIQHKLKNQSE